MREQTSVRIGPPPARTTLDQPGPVANWSPSTHRDRSKRLGRVALCLLAAIAIAKAASAAPPETIRFNEQIRPILAERCFACHGPDAKRRDADLRLDTFDGAASREHDPPAVVPGNPDASAMIARVTSNDESERMPPADSKKPPLSQDEVALLRKWIEQGAEYEGHWAFLPLAADPPPTVAGESWVRNPIDRFVLAKLEAAKIAPSPEADRATLIRRVYLDLTGLLPTPEEVESFLNNDDAQAYETLVDRLLESPHYGERWGRYWLDQARYADSNGYSIDGEREMWPYRDWVIQSLNDDMPFDQFTIEQIAGDLLPQPTKSQLVATGYHRNTLINQEGGSDREQFRVESVVDRVNTTGAVWLGLTIGCAQCHSHKFDPIAQREYYELFAFFNSTADANDQGPTVEVRRGEMFGRPIELPQPEPQLAADELARLRTAWETATRDRLAAAAKDSAGEPAEWLPAEYVEARGRDGATFRRLEDNSLLTDATVAAHDQYRLVVRADLPQVAAIRLRTLTDESLPQKGPGRAGNGNFVLTRVDISHGGRSIAVRRAFADHEQPSYPVAAVLDDDPKSGWAINVGAGSKFKMNAPHEAVFVLTEPVKLKAADSPSSDDAAKDETDNAKNSNGAILDNAIEIRLNHELHADYLIGRFAIDLAATAPPVELTNADANLLTALKASETDRTDEQKKTLQAAFERDEPRAVPPKPKPSPDVAKAMVMRELPQPRETFVLTRGDFTRPDKDAGVLRPDVLYCVAPPLTSFSSPESDAPPVNRLELARWLVHPENPLTPRVTMNRVWMRYFGRGIVTTEEDFGSQGTPPTHPALLDWLGGELIRRGWRMKEMHRLIVTSATYRQSSRPRPELVELDPRNLLLARQERLRLDAEAIRDAALCASGLFNPAVGGRSVHPPQPDGVYAFTQVSKRWNADEGPERFRRGMYTFFYRSAPHPLFTTFDAPDFQSVCTRRNRSNTPLQSLALANDVAFVEMAQGLAARMVREVPAVEPKRDEPTGPPETADASGSVSRELLDARIRRAYLAALAREPNETERTVLRDYFDRQRQSFSNDNAAAEQLAPADLRAAAGPADAAALVALARVILNTDNFVTRE